MNFSQRDIEEGRKRLVEMLTDLRKAHDPRKMGSFQPNSQVGNTVMQHIRKESLDALVIRRSTGGWHADLLLKGMPAGVGNVLGTPEAMPLPSREAALDAGKIILEEVYLTALENEAAYRDAPLQDIRYFDLYGHVFGLPRETVDHIAKLWHLVGYQSVPDPETARAHLMEKLAPCLRDDSFDISLFEALDDTRKSLIIASLATLMVFNEFRHPPVVQAEPFPEDEGPTA